MGINVDSDKKIVIGTWRYGSGIEGFKKMATRAWGENTNSIQKAEEYIKTQEKVKKIKENLYHLSDKEVNNVKKLVDEIIQEPQKG